MFDLSKYKMQRVCQLSLLLIPEQKEAFAYSQVPSDDQVVAALYYPHGDLCKFLVALMDK